MVRGAAPRLAGPFASGGCRGLRGSPYARWKLHWTPDGVQFVSGAGRNAATDGE